MILLDRLEEICGGKLRLAGRAWVDTESAAELISKIRTALPDEIREAEWLVSEKERLLDEAQEEAKRILRDAENYAAKLVQDSQIIRQAEHEAEGLIEDAKREAAAVREEAGDYVQHVLAQLEESLERTLRVVRKSQGDLAGRE
jgi:vacuolar-type H+-ATPase subunit H